MLLDLAAHADVVEYLWWGAGAGGLGWDGRAGQE